MRGRTARLGGNAITRTFSQPFAESALAVDAKPPSMKRRPPISTGGLIPGKLQLRRDRSRRRRAAIAAEQHDAAVACIHRHTMEPPAHSAPRRTSAMSRPTPCQSRSAPQGHKRQPAPAPWPRPRRRYAPAERATAAAKSPRDCAGPSRRAATFGFSLQRSLQPVQQVPYPRRVAPRRLRQPRFRWSGPPARPPLPRAASPATSPLSQATASGPPPLSTSARIKLLHPERQLCLPTAERTKIGLPAKATARLGRLAGVPSDEEDGAGAPVADQEQERVIGAEDHQGSVTRAPVIEDRDYGRCGSGFCPPSPRPRQKPGGRHCRSSGSSLPGQETAALTAFSPEKSLSFENAVRIPMR